MFTHEGQAFNGRKGGWPEPQSNTLASSFASLDVALSSACPASSSFSGMPTSTPTHLQSFKDFRVEKLYVVTFEMMRYEGYGHLPRRGTRQYDILRRELTIFVVLGTVAFSHQRSTTGLYTTRMLIAIIKEKRKYSWHKLIRLISYEPSTRLYFEILYSEKQT